MGSERLIESFTQTINVKHSGTKHHYMCYFMLKCYSVWLGKVKELCLKF